MKRLLYGLCPLLLLASTAVQGTGYFSRPDSLDPLHLAYDGGDPDTRAAYYSGYVAGVADSTLGSAWCPTARISARQVNEIVARHLNEHKAAPDGNAEVTVLAALAASFPCSGRASKE